MAHLGAWREPQCPLPSVPSAAASPFPGTCHVPHCLKDASKPGLHIHLLTAGTGWRGRPGALGDCVSREGEGSALGVLCGAAWPGESEVDGLSSPCERGRAELSCPLYLMCRCLWRSGCA